MGRTGARNRRGDVVSAERTWQLLLGTLPLACLLALWHGIAATGLAPAALLPAPVAVFARLLEQAGNPFYLAHAATTLVRLFAGFGIAVVLGVALGLAAASNRRAEALIRPLWRVLA